MTGKIGGRGMPIEIMSWNTALTESSTSCLEVFRYIKAFLDRPNTIAVLQQLPLKDPKNGWKQHPINRMFGEYFPAPAYKIFQNSRYNRGYIFMQTVVVTRLQTVQAADVSCYPNGVATNREAAVKVVCGPQGASREFVILGIHARNGDENKAYLNALHGKADIILGDFNAGDYPESENRETFKKILGEHVCICSLPTKRVFKDGKTTRKTCIDHIFVRDRYVAGCSDFAVHESVTCSDHFPISVKIDL